MPWGVAPAYTVNACVFTVYLVLLLDNYLSMPVSEIRICEL